MKIILVTTVITILMIKSSSSSCTNNNYPARGRVIYQHIVCQNMKLERGKPLQVLNRRTNEYKYIKFVNSSISLVPVGVFTSVATVSLIYLNNANVHVLEPGAFGGLTKLQELRLEGNNIALISRGTFNSLTTLNILDLSNNSLTQIEDNALHGLLALERLNLSNNNLSNLSSSTVASLSSLKYLDLSINNISTIEENSFSNLGKLELLQISSNRLKNFPVLLFQNTSALKILNVSFNLMEAFDFNNLPRSVENINLTYNRLNSVRNTLYSGKLKSLDLQRNNISEMFSVGASLTYLDLSNNNVKKLSSGEFDMAAGLERLNISYNTVSQIEIDSFRGLSKLLYLHLDWNQIQHLPIGSFRNVPKLRYLWLDHNLFSNFEFGTFSGLDYLEELFINDNKLTALHENSFHVFTRLKVLKFHNNEINVLNADHFLKQLKNLKAISFFNNNLDCNSVLSAVASFKSKNILCANGDTFNEPNIYGIRCLNNNSVISNSGTDASEIIAASSARSLFESNFENNFTEVNVYKHLDKAFKNTSFYKFFEIDFPKLFKNATFFEQFDERSTNTTRGLEIPEELFSLRESNNTLKALVTPITICMALLFILNFIGLLIIAYVLWSKNKFTNYNKSMPAEIPLL